MRKFVNYLMKLKFKLDKEFFHKLITNKIVEKTFWVVVVLLLLMFVSRFSQYKSESEFLELEENISMLQEENKILESQVAVLKKYLDSSYKISKLTTNMYNSCAESLNNCSGQDSMKSLDMPDLPEDVKELLE